MNSVGYTQCDQVMIPSETSWEFLVISGTPSSSKIGFWAEYQQKQLGLENNWIRKDLKEK